LLPKNRYRPIDVKTAVLTLHRGSAANCFKPIGRIKDFEAMGAFAIPDLN
jgi:hypothetical protein